MILTSPYASGIGNLSFIIPDTSIALHFSDVLEKIIMEVRTQRSSTISLCNGRLLKGLRVAVSSEQATTLHEGKFMSFDGIICVSDVEAPPIARTSQESEAETAKLTLGKLERSIEN
ncbi:uncharacterized protein F5147DRAFT_768320 [Suillus discolor]|uniref:Uncharacterized protein n=1 Tax=Suillus discolor TaxID=1912936 RepID=A0A9P7JZM2_9AGAM|nr:uncharacterized protein F5147DRAFT_768320 [Suillus discolor]KAG2118188.1 hypothetical protein F5147DRAFT_768320 [Suillus discolor]